MAISYSTVLSRISKPIVFDILSDLISSRPRRPASLFETLCSLDHLANHKQQSWEIQDDRLLSIYRDDVQ